MTEIVKHKSKYVLFCSVCVDGLNSILYQTMADKNVQLPDVLQHIFTHLHSIFLSILQIYTSLNFCICSLSKHLICQLVEI